MIYFLSYIYIGHETITGKTLQFKFKLFEEEFNNNMLKDF